MNLEITRQITAFLLAVELILHLTGYATGVVVAGGQNAQPGVAATIKDGDKAANLLPDGFNPTKHFYARMAERGVTVEQVADTLRNGRRFFDPKYNEAVWWKDGIYIPVANDGAMKTVIRGPLNKRWRPL